ncbi:apolipoprotein D-like [Periplaneta americana]|uniref:apolipoprotein D-like n=1 Tax=Periplaneta americana TaxID=6978 RepID=UPI0037E9C663
MSKLSSALLLLVCCGLAAAHFHINRCLPVPGKYPFDEEKFSGEWFSVANAVTPKKFNSAITCEKVHYKADKMGNVSRVYIDAMLKLSDGTEKKIEGKGEGVMPGVTSCTNMAYKSSEDEKFRKVMKQSILATDYETYALVHACKEFYDDKTDMFTKFVVNEIWSRSKTLDEEKLKTLKSVMSGLNIDDDKWELIDNAAC